MVAGLGTLGAEGAPGKGKMEKKEQTMEEAFHFPVGSYRHGNFSYLFSPHS